MVYLICGKARSGKDTLAGYLKKELESRGKKVCTVHLVNSLKDMVYHYFGWDGNDETKPRELLQKLGTDIIRNEMHKDMFFINRTLEDMEIISRFYDTFIIPDCRLPIEIKSIKFKYPDTKVIKVIRDGFESELTDTEKSHITETALDNYSDFDVYVHNTTLESLEKAAENIAKEGK